MRCICCNTENDNGSFYCRNCGKSLLSNVSYLNELDSAILNFSPEIKWGSTSLVNHVGAKKTSFWSRSMPVKNCRDVNLVHNKNFKTCTAIVIGKDCALDSLNPVFSLWNFNWSINQWVNFLKLNNVDFKPTLLGGRGWIDFSTLNFFISVEFDSASTTSLNAAKKISLAYKHTKKAGLFNLFK